MQIRVSAKTFRKKIGINGENKPSGSVQFCMLGKKASDLK
jgi:hypothetical protein